MAELGSLMNNVRIAAAGLPEKQRGTLLAQVTEYYVVTAGSLEPEDHTLFENLVAASMDGLEPVALSRIATALSETPYAPVRLVRALAMSEDALVAGPILAKSPLLRDAELIDIARTRGSPHLQAIAERPSLSEALTLVLVERGDANVLHRLVGNPGARLVEASVSLLCRRAGDDYVLVVKAIGRPEVEAGVADRILRDGPPALRSKIVGYAKAAPRSGGAGPGVGLQLDDQAFTAALERQSELLRHGRLAEADVKGALEAKDTATALAALLLLAREDVEFIKSCWRSADLDALLMVARSAGVGWDTAQMMLRRAGLYEATRLAALGRSYKALKRETARSILSLKKRAASEAKIGRGIGRR